MVSPGISTKKFFTSLQADIGINPFVIGREGIAHKAYGHT
jgi:hypothetical protein